jgi:hypothetical protein
VVDDSATALPVEGAEVELTDGQVTVTTQTTPQGVFTFNVGQGLGYTVAAGKTGYDDAAPVTLDHTSATTDVDQAGGPLVLTAKTGTIELLVLDTSAGTPGTVVGDADVTLTDLAGTDATATTDTASGIATFAGLRTGGYTVEITVTDPATGIATTHNPSSFDVAGTTTSPTLDFVGDGTTTVVPATVVIP